MLRFTQGNLLDADVEALVNTVNTVGVMGKGIALMFKEKFPANFKAYAAACRRGEVQVGRMFVTASDELPDRRWIINFPTKKHWRHPSKMEWIVDGLSDLRRVITEKGIRSLAIPPLGSGHGGLRWSAVRAAIVKALEDLSDVEIVIYEPTGDYVNAPKASGVEELTPARALIVEMIRRYGILGVDCSILEVHKLAWMLTRVARQHGLPDPLQLSFTAQRYGPFAPELRHLLDALDGSFLHADKRLADASSFDTIYFDSARGPQLADYFSTAEGAVYTEAIALTDQLIDGFQSPLGMEALATVDWLLSRELAEPTVAALRQALESWPGGAGDRKQRLFSDQLLQAAVERLRSTTAQHV